MEASDFVQVALCHSKESMSEVWDCIREANLGGFMKSFHGVYAIYVVQEDTDVAQQVLGEHFYGNKMVSLNLNQSKK